MNKAAPRILISCVFEIMLFSLITTSNYLLFLPSINMFLLICVIRVELDPHVRDCVQTYVREWLIVNQK